MSALEQLLTVLENTALLLTKAQTNLKKCPKARLTRGYINTRLQSVEEYWNTFKKVHMELVKCVPKEKKPDIPYFVNEDFFVYEDLYTCIQADLKDLLDGSTSSLGNNSSVNNGNGDGLVKLPRIQLPSFSGIYEEWPSYKDLFTSLVHNNQALSDVQKLHYLKSTLTGEAETLLRHVQVTDGNYNQSWTMLKKRYGNKRIIVNSVLKRLFMQRKLIAQTANNIKSLLDTTTECINSLNNLEVSTDSWDPLVIFLVVQKLDPETHREWEQHAYQEDAEELPSYDDLKMFLQSKYRTLELIAPPSREKTFKPREYAVHVSTTFNTKPRRCVMCNEDHTLCHCREFTKMQPTERCDYVKTHNLCFNCLAPGHSARRCHLNMSCRICHKHHHTLVHQTTPVVSSNRADNIQAHHSKIEEDEEEEEEQSEDTASPIMKLSSHFTTCKSTALLATALVPVKDDAGNITVLRALVDHGSQATLISERAAQMLRIKRTPVTGTVTGVGSTTTNVKHGAQVELLSRHDASFKLKVKIYIMSTQLTNQLPSSTISTNTWPHLQGLVLADPSFNLPGRVDMLLGVDVCSQIMKSEVIKGPPGTPCAQNTSLGWILFGNVQHDEQRDDVVVMHLNLDLDDMLKRMWEQDKDEKRKPTADERKCEEIYQATTTRTDDGRYVVKLPTKTNMIISTQEETRNIALRRLYQLERRFKQDSKLKSEYVRVMEEYKELKHMQEVPKDKINKPAVYLSHHVVVNEGKETSQVRPVFNTSQKGNNDVSPDDELLVGPQLRDDMRSLIRKWRMKKLCYVADVDSRGQPLLDLKSNLMWWKGPKWLTEGEIPYSRPKNITTNLKRKEIQINLKIQSKEDSFSPKFEVFDDLSELTRGIVYCKRFLKGKELKDKEKTMTTTELNEALKSCIRIVQKEKFEEDIEKLKTEKRVRSKGKLQALQPYLDEEGILRVGGRLRHANLNEEQKHPIILENDTYLTTLIVREAHLKTLHGGHQLMLEYLRSKYWILEAKNAVKSIIRKYLICAKQNAVARSQVMGDLPSVRVNPDTPFLHSGVDFPDGNICRSCVMTSGENGNQSSSRDSNRDLNGRTNEKSLKWDKLFL